MFPGMNSMNLVRSKSRVKKNTKFIFSPSDRFRFNFVYENNINSNAPGYNDVIIVSDRDGCVCCWLHCRRGQRNGYVLHCSSAIATNSVQKICFALHSLCLSPQIVSKRWTWSWLFCRFKWLLLCPESSMRIFPIQCKFWDDTSFSMWQVHACRLYCWAVTEKLQHVPIRIRMTTKWLRNGISFWLSLLHTNSNMRSNKTNTKTS